MVDQLVLVAIKDLNFPNGQKSWVPAKLPGLPVAGDTLIIRQGDGEWTGTVTSRTFRDSGSDDPNIVVECEARFQADG